MNFGSMSFLKESHDDFSSVKHVNLWQKVPSILDKVATNEQELLRDKSTHITFKSKVLN